MERKLIPIEELFDLKPLSGNRYGIEIEVENFDLKSTSFGEIWYEKQDGSLRNGGKEFVSVPLKLEEVEPALQNLFSCLKLNSNSFSERTSIHVHCNMNGLSSDNIASMALLYVVFEEIFFAYVDKTRRKNIFCVALKEFDAAKTLSDTFYPENFGHGIFWEKYSAFNLLPLSSLGTLEFRHMHGNNNIPYIVTWIAAIDRLKEFSQTHSFSQWIEEIKILNNTSEYFAFAHRVFTDKTGPFLRGLNYSDYKPLMYNGVTQAKLWEMLNQKKKELAKKTQQKKKPKAKITQTIINDDMLAFIQNWPTTDTQPQPDVAAEGPAQQELHELLLRRDVEQQAIVQMVRQGNNVRFLTVDELRAMAEQRGETS